MSFLHDLYRGNINVSEYNMPDTKAFRAAVKASVQASDTFQKSLTEEQKELYDAYMAARSRLDDMEQEHYFCLGGKLVAQIVMEALEWKSEWDRQ